MISGQVYSILYSHGEGIMPKSPLFGRRHYNYIAEAIKEELPGCGEEMAKFLVMIFEQDNPRFDGEKFIKACGVEDEENATS